MSRRAGKRAQRYGIRGSLAAACLVLAACQSPTAGHGWVEISPTTATSEGPAFSVAGPVTTLNLRLTPEEEARGPRRLAALPASWDQAVLRFSSPTAQTAPTTLTLAFGDFTFVNPYYEYVGDDVSSPIFPVLRPSNDYTVTADLETLVPATTLEGYGRMPGLQTINAGLNTFPIPLVTTGSQGAEITVDPSLGAQARPKVAYDSTHDEYLVVWIDAGDVKARRYDAAGAPLGAIVTVNASPGTAADPVVAYNPNPDKYVIAWADSANGHSDVVTNNLDSTGTLGTETYVTHTVGHTANETTPAIAAAINADRFLVCWTDDRNLATGGLDIYANRIDAAGAPAGEITVASSAVVIDQTSPVAAYAVTSDRFLVVFEDDASGNQDLRYQRIAATTGAAQDGSAGGVLSGAAGDQTQAAIGYNGADNLFLTAWCDTRGGGSGDVFYNVINPATAAFAVTDTGLATEADAQSDPAVAFNASHKDWLIAFADDRGGTLDLYTRRLQRDALTPHGEKTLTAGADHQRRVAIAYGATGDQCLAAWEDDRLGAGQTDIYAQRVR
jgi:hypothetical protein